MNETWLPLPVEIPMNSLFCVRDGCTKGSISFVLKQLEYQSPNFDPLPQSSSKVFR